MAERWRNREKHAQDIFNILHPGMRICVFDTETTGLPSKKRTVKIIQFSWQVVRINEDFSLEKETERPNSWFINPEEELSSKIVQLTGLTDRLLENCASEEKAAPYLFSVLDDCDAWAAYNKSFDIARLEELADRSGLRHSYNEIVKPSVDILEWTRDWLKKGEEADEVTDYKLGTVVTALCPYNIYDFHKADEDVKATADVMIELIGRYKTLLETDPDPKRIPVVEKAKAWVNPYNQHQQRIILQLDSGNIGDIFYDCIEKCWSCKSNTKAKKLFHSVDMGAVERQVLKLCSNSYVTYSSMDQLARERMAYIRKKKAEQKQQDKNQLSFE